MKFLHLKRQGIGLMGQYSRILIFLTAWYLTASALTAPGMPDTAGKSFFISAAFAEEDKKKTQETDEAAEGQENPCPECPECPDPAKVVLRGLEDKKNAIDRQQKLLEKQRKDLAIFEEQIDEKISQLQKLREQITSDMALLEEKKTQKEREREAAYEARIGRLVKMYAGMKPKAAAQIVNGLDLEVAQEIFLRMREASASQILAFVNSEKAGKISERLAFRRK